MPIPNVVQFTGNTPPVSSFKYNNFYLGVQDQNYGPTSNTNFWNGISVPNGGYVIYLNKATQGPSIYVPENEEDAFNLMKMIYPPFVQPTSFYNYLLELFGSNNRTDGIIINRNYENIITDNLYISIDPSFYMCTVYSAGTPSTVKNMVVPNLIETNNNLINTAAKSSDFGGILSYDGFDDRMVIVDFNFNQHLRFSGDVTYEFFVRLKELTGATIPMYYKSPVHEGSLSANSANKLVYSYGDGTTDQTFTSTTALTNNNWYHIVLVRDLTGTPKKLYWYINGSEDKSESATYGSAATSSESTTIFQNGPAGQEFALADLGVLRIYNSALTAAQVSQNFNAQKSRFGF